LTVLCNIKEGGCACFNSAHFTRHALSEVLVQSGISTPFWGARRYRAGPEKIVPLASNDSLSTSAPTMAHCSAILAQDVHKLVSNFEPLGIRQTGTRRSFRLLIHRIPKKFRAQSKSSPASRCFMTGRPNSFVADLRVPRRQVSGSFR